MSEQNNFIESEKLFLNINSLKDIIRLFANLPIMRLIIPVCLVVNLMAAALPSAFRWYMAKLIDCDLTDCSNVNIPIIHQTISPNIKFFFLLTMLAVTLRIISWIIYEVPGQLSTKHIHRQMVNSLFATKTTYFDQNPSGRLLNKLIKDFGAIRYDIIIWSGDFLNASLEVIISTLLLCFISPWLILLTPLLFIMFFYFQYHIAAILQVLRQFQSHSRSNLLHRYSDLIDGSDVFELYQKMDSLYSRIRKALNEYSNTALMYAKAEAWGGFWLSLTGEIYSFVIFLFLVFAVRQKLIDAAITGTIISAVFGLSATLGWLNMATSNLASSLIHAKRVFEIIDLPNEVSEELKTPKAINHTSKNHYLFETEAHDIIFEDYSMSYRENTKIILQNLNLKIPGGKKTAIIGKTGAGKTSLMQSLMRMVYVHEGDIKIGGESIFSLDIKKYRSIFGIIPQNPWLFSGTLRDNLDRQRLLTDEKLFEYLDMAEINLDLNKSVLEGGSNFSPGERQLIAIIRVLAANKLYLFLDEPTSSIDPQTDAKITKLLSHFKQNKTLIIIAHRMQTIQNSDYIIDLDLACA